ncbi:MAG TPA: beta-L-arabinofuranosidase domain-containing protein [Thermoanaerobaculia bacterium]|nr:beta-L-arabinofuranosidase domain-containing protein [Thermoanaerobaculia bacterium]
MKRTGLPSAAVTVWLAVAWAACAGAPGDENAGDSPGIEPVPITAVTIDDEFWAPRLERNRTVTVPHILEQNEATGRIANFRRAAGLEEGPFEGPRYNDSDVYKSIEAASYVLAQEHPERDSRLDARLDALIELIAASQQPDGYLFPARTVDPENPPVGVGPQRWDWVHSNSHELYGAGHLIEAAVAHHQATGKRTLLEVAIRLADHIDGVFGPDGLHSAPGHPEVELALVKLADVTGERRYLELARFFLDQRGHPHDTGEEPEESPLSRYDVPVYRQDHLPVTEQREAVGHSVRAMYLYTGMADVASRMEGTGYERALDSLWRDVIGAKTYLTGGIGARDTFESFGEPYELPNDTAYAESCAAVGLELWNHRMFLRSGDVRYVDVMERILYNGALAGISEEGDLFFYTNPLASSGDHERRPYFRTACCPGNLARLMGTLPGYVYASSTSRRGDVLYVNLFVAGRATVELAGGEVKVRQETRYPWEGRVRIELDPGEDRELEVRVRVPGWARGEVVPSDLYRFDDELAANDALEPVVRVDGDAGPLEIRDGWATTRRVFRSGDLIEIELPMPVRLVRAHERVEADAGKIALQRGPVVYAVEGVDHDGRVHDLMLLEGAPLRVVERPELLGGVATIETVGRRIGGSAAGEAVPISAIPYAVWANRGKGEMAVWLPTVDADAPAGD